VKTQLVVTIVSPDRPGLVDLVSKTLVAHDANWESSRMVRLGGRFAGVLLASVDPQGADALASALSKLGNDGMKVIVDRSGEATAAEGRTLVLELVGQDRPGIVHDISAAIARRNVNVEELHTECDDAPMAGGQLFKLRAELRADASLDRDELRETLEGLAADLMVDLSIREE
jgi:glycine cleavage system regulatory protein